MSECSGTIWRNMVVREVREGSGGRGHMYTCGLFMLMYSKNHHDIGKKKKKQLSDGELGLNTESKHSHT